MSHVSSCVAQPPHTHTCTHAYTHTHTHIHTHTHTHTGAHTHSFTHTYTDYVIHVHVHACYSPCVHVWCPLTHCLTMDSAVLAVCLLYRVIGLCSLLLLGRLGHCFCANRSHDGGHCACACEWCITLQVHCVFLVLPFWHYYALSWLSEKKKPLLCRIG